MSYQINLVSAVRTLTRIRLTVIRYKDMCWNMSGSSKMLLGKDAMISSRLEGAEDESALANSCGKYMS